MHILLNKTLQITLLSPAKINYITTNIQLSNERKTIFGENVYRFYSLIMVSNDTCLWYKRQLGYVCSDKSYNPKYPSQL